MKIAFIGATRGIGLTMAQAALADGHQITVLARTPSRMPFATPICISSKELGERGTTKQ